MSWHKRHIIRWGKEIPAPVPRRLFLFVALLLGPSVLAAPLQDSDFHQIGEPGFGDRANSYAWSMAEFYGKVYIGTNRNFLCSAPLQSTFISGDHPEIPVECEPDILDMDMRARIYTYDHATKQIELVYISPTQEVLLSDGSRVQVARDHGYRTMAVYREPDGTEALYVGSMISSKLPGPLHARVLRSTDGRTFAEVPVNTPALANYTSFRSLTVYDNRLFALSRSPNVTDPALVVLSDPATGFDGVSDGTFGDPANQGGFEMEIFKGYLYIGTFSDEGFQLLKTTANGQPPYVFQKVLIEGAYRGPDSQSVVSLAEYKDQLYVGTGVFFGSSALNPDFQPAAAELLRVDPDDSWELLVGEERNTPDGYRAPLTGRDAGFGNAFTGYMWRMVVHDGVLYVATLDTSVFAQYATDIDISQFTDETILEEFPLLAEIIEEIGPDEIADVLSAVEGGFDMWSTEDGLDWNLVTRIGFNDEFNYGIRNFISMPFGLLAGSANPFLGLRLYLGQPEGTDSDGDSFPDLDDNCPLEWNLNQADLDEDGIGDACDDDQDGDCIPDASDPNPGVPQTAGLDTDADGVPDACDNDDDADGILDHQDNCPLVANLDQSDIDADGIGDVCDATDPTPGTPIPSDDENPTPMCGAIGLIPLSLCFLTIASTNMIRRREISRNGASRLTHI